MDHQALNLLLLTAEHPVFETDTAGQVIGPKAGLSLHEALTQIVSAAHAAGVQAGAAQPQLAQQEACLTAWRTGAKFGMLALARQDIAFLTDSMREAAVRVAVEACVQERDRLASAA